MTTPTFDLNSLIELTDALRLAGYDIGTQQYIAAQNLLTALAANEQLPSDPRELRTWLAPILCSSPREQDSFYRQFDAWVANHPDVDQRKDVIGPDPPYRKRADSESKSKWFRLAGQPRTQIAAAILAVILVGGLYLWRRTPGPRPTKTLAGTIVDFDTSETLPSALISFGEQNLISDTNGQFSITYHPEELPQNLVIAREQYESETIPIAADTASPLTIQLQKPLPPPPPPVSTPSSSTTPKPRPTPLPTPVASIEPIPLLEPPPTPNVKRDYLPALKWVSYGAAMFALLLVGGWSLWKLRLSRALLQKLRSGIQPRLNEIVVKGAESQLFQGQSFRRTIQELRRHRQRGASDLDAQQTVMRTVRNGGLFTPSYGSRQTLPEYLILIDRASFRDQQARLEEEIVRRLVQDNVFVDTYYFQGDPRLCRKQEITAPYLSLQEMAALHPDHHLVIFTDGATFMNPLTGKPERWIEMFSAWNKRALLTPESPAHWGYRERALAESDLIILPATIDGLAALTEVLSNDKAPALTPNRMARPFPSMLRERPKRWLESHEPQAEDAHWLDDELKLFLGRKGYYWLSACAIYPSLYWDLTLYLGFKLFDDRAEIEDRLLSLVRLPWFRHGNIPDWLRLKLISSLSTQQEKAVRRALEQLFVTVLDRPAHGLRLEIASKEGHPEGSLQRLRQGFKNWKKKKSLWQFFKTEPPHSPLRDYVFLTFMSGRRPKKLAVSIPSTLRRALFPDGQAALGLRTVSALVLVTFLAASVFFISHTFARQPPPTSPPARSPYSQMSPNEQRAFVRERGMQLSQMLGPNSYEFSDGAIDSIKPYVDYYANRVGNDSRELWNEDLRFLLARASQQYAPTIIQAFRKRGVSSIVGLYIPMAYTEYLDHPSDNAAEASGLFQFTAANATDHGVDPRDRNDAAKMAALAAGYMSSAAYNLGKDARGMSLAILSYERGIHQVLLDQEQFLKDPKFDGTYWYLQAHASQLDAKFQNEDIRYVPKVFAAAIVGENPQSFGLLMNPLSSYSAVEPEAAISQQIADLIAKLKGPQRRSASDQLVQLYQQNKAVVVERLIDALLDGGPDSYRINLYVARTLGSIQPKWEGTSDQLAKVQALKASKDYQDPTFKYWVDRTISAYTETPKVSTSPSPSPTRPPTPTPSGSPTPNILGSVYLSASPSTVPVGARVTFTARTNSRDPNIWYRFVFGDGQSTNWQQGSQTQYTYLKAGSYTARAEARRAQMGSVPTTVSSQYIRIQVQGDQGLGVIPNLIGKSEAEVRGMFNPKMEFSLGAVTYKEDSNHSVETVIYQHPAPATRAANGTKIDIVIARAQPGNFGKHPDSSGTQLVKVPNVIGMVFEEASRSLRAAGLTPITKLGKPSSQSPILKQYPAPGKSVQKGSTVDLYY